MVSISAQRTVCVPWHRSPSIIVKIYTRVSVSLKVSQIKTASETFLHDFLHRQKLWANFTDRRLRVQKLMEILPCFLAHWMALFRIYTFVHSYLRSYLRFVRFVRTFVTWYLIPSFVPSIRMYIRTPSYLRRYLRGYIYEGTFEGIFVTLFYERKSMYV